MKKKNQFLIKDYSLKPQGRYSSFAYGTFLGHSWETGTQDSHGHA